MEEDFSKEELREIMFKILDDAITIEEAIDQKKQEKEMLEETYKVCMSTYKTISYNNRRLDLILNLAKLRYRLYNLLTAMRYSSMYDGIITKIDEVQDRFQNEKELLTEIKNSLKLLKKNEVIVCNVQIAYLLSLIYDLNEMMIKEFGEYTRASTLKLKGITYYGNKTYDEEIESLENTINLQCLRLGLSKKYELSGNNSDNLDD